MRDPEQRSACVDVHMGVLAHIQPELGEVAQQRGALRYGLGHHTLDLGVGAKNGIARRVVTRRDTGLVTLNNVYGPGVRGWPRRATPTDTGLGIRAKRILYPHAAVVFAVA
jgi:hypothetical protein